MTIILFSLFDILTLLFIEYCSNIYNMDYKFELGVN